jgi:O-antigen/teichoic acid export membrane protein
LTITRNAFWLLGCRVIGDFLNLLLFILISRKFGPAGVGAYSYGFAVTGFVFVIGCLGIEEYGLREYARMDPTRQAPLLSELLGAQVLMIAMAVSGVGIYLLLTAPTHSTLVIMASLGFYQAMVALAGTLFIPAMGHQRMTGPALIDLVCRGVAFSFAGIAIYVWHLAVAQALLGYVLAGALLVALARSSAVRHGGALRIRVSWSALVNIVSILWSFAAVEVLTQLFARVGVIVLSLKVGEAAAGLYATGLRLIEVGLMPLAFIGVAAYPQLSRLYRDDKAAFQNFGLNFIWIVLAAGLILAWGVNFIAPQLLVPVLGSKYAGSEPIVQMMAGLALIQALEVGMGRVLFAANLQVARAVAIVLGAASALGLNLWLAPAFGVRGSIVAGVLSFAIIDTIYALALRRPLGGARLLRALTVPLSGLAVAVVLVWLCRLLLMPAWLQAAAAAIAIVSVLGADFWQRHHRQPARAGSAHL